MLLGSGLFHLVWLIIRSESWEGPLSARKPALFGISGGLTLWSLSWVVSRLQSGPFDGLALKAMGSALVTEVALITLQYWRGVRSHFNHAEPLDAAIEGAMLLLILGITLGIALLCWRSRWLKPASSAEHLALRAGLAFLLLSCLLGIGTTALGEWNQSHGMPPELWKGKGVLKYPHGAALHAIQWLPLLAWLMVRGGARRPSLWVSLLIAGQTLLLVQALWQTFTGRGRLEVDGTGLTLLVAASVLMVGPLVVCTRLGWRWVARASVPGRQIQEG